LEEVPRIADLDDARELVDAAPRPRSSILTAFFQFALRPPISAALAHLVTGLQKHKSGTSRRRQEDYAGSIWDGGAAAFLLDKLVAAGAAAIGAVSRELTISARRSPF
jgi:hypothetical protein